jgi:hypothetical protein
LRAALHDPEPAPLRSKTSSPADTPHRRRSATGSTTVRRVPNRNTPPGSGFITTEVATPVAASRTDADQPNNLSRGRTHTRPEASMRAIAYARPHRARPCGFSRHTTAHAITEPDQVNPTNALIAVMLAVSLICQAADSEWTALRAFVWKDENARNLLLNFTARRQTRPDTITPSDSPAELTSDTEEV